jgi:hypothetical protein
LEADEATIRRSSSSYSPLICEPEFQRKTNLPASIHQSIRFSSER